MASPDDRDTAAGQRPGAASLREWLVDLLAGREFSPKQLQLARFLEANPRAAALHTASEIAEQTGVNAATVVRFAQALGFKGWPSLQVEMRNRAMSEMLPSALIKSQGVDDSLDPVEAAIRADLRNLQVALETVDGDEVRAIAELIARSRRTVIVSAGSFAAVGQVLAYNANVMGFPLSLENRSGPDLMAAIGGLDERDLVIGISFWRLSRQVVLAMESARRRGIPTAAITDSMLSPLTERAQHSLVVPIEGVGFFQSLTAAVSVTYGLLTALRQTAGDKVDEHIRSLEDLYFELDVLYH